ncbi:MAG: stage III sporulation protein AB [Roseburia sp.]
MLKLLGSGLIFTASIGLAFHIRRDLEGHLRLLYEIRKMLTDIFYAASESMQPVEILLGCFVRMRDERLNEACKEIAEALIERREENGEEVWKKAFELRRKTLGLYSEEAEIVEGAGSAFFGKSVEENRKHLQYSLERLDFIITHAREGQKEKQRVAQTVSVAGGLVLILLLL